jgi:hypothetical protein
MTSELRLLSSLVGGGAWVRYIPPFERIKAYVRTSVAADGAVRVSTPYEDLMRMFQALLGAIDIDEAWYLQQNPDVADGIRAGTIKSAKEHFLDHGYFEGRAPFPMTVDETWYLATNADVAEQVRLGSFASGQAHFNASGYRDGRLPRPK